MATPAESRGCEEWAVTFLVSGFSVPNLCRIGLVEFSPPLDHSSPDFGLLVQSAEIGGLPFRVDTFPRATIHVSEREPRNAIKWGLLEIDRTLDTLAFTDFGCSKYLPVGFVTCRLGGSHAEPIGYRETAIPSPIAVKVEPPVLEGYRLCDALRFQAHSQHLLARTKVPLSESEEALAAGLRWCRLGSLSRAFSESTTVAFVLEWTALESLLLTHDQDRVKDALGRRIPKLLRHWPTRINTDYWPRLRSTDLGASEQEWRDLVLQDLYPHRRDVFHGREFHVPNDPSGPPLGHRSFGFLEAILGRVVAFVGKRSRTEPSLRVVWEGVDAYQPDDDDAPPSNLGGWSRWGPTAGPLVRRTG
jgi:hypothetical protein